MTHAEKQILLDILMDTIRPLLNKKSKHSNPLDGLSGSPVSLPKLIGQQSHMQLSRKIRGMPSELKEQVGRQHHYSLRKL